MKNLLILCGALSLRFLSAADAYGQPASVTWNLTAPDSMHVSSMSGNITAQDQSLTDLYVPASGGYSTNSAQRTSARSGGVDGTWIAESAENPTRYMQFAVAPTVTNDLLASSISLYLWVNSGSNMRANVYYSTDPSFASRTQIGSTVVLSGTVPGSPNITATPGLTVSSGQTFYLRVYPWYTTATTGKYVVTRTVVISGTTSTAGAAITPSMNSLNGFSQTVGVPSTTQMYTVSGSGLTDNVVVTPPAGFEVSSDGGGSWGTTSSPVTLSVNGGIIVGQPLTMSVRLNASTGGAYAGNITHASIGVTTANVAVGGFALAPEPTVQSSVTFDTVTGNSIVVNFSGGNGSNRVVAVRQGAAVSWIPTDGIAVSGVNSNFTLATDQGGGNKVVYDGTGTVVTVTGLSQNTTYDFAVYEYNVGTGNSQNYTTSSPGTGSQTTLAVPTIVVDPSALAFGGVEINTTSIERTYSLSGATLTPASGAITVTAPSGYQVSTTSGSGFASSVDVQYSAGTLTATTIYVVFLPANLTSYPGSIAHAGGGASTENVSVSGTGIGPAQQNVLEAENGILSSAYVSTQYSGYSGLGYVDIANKTGASLEIDFRRTTAATDTVRVFYALGAGSRSYAVTLNSAAIGSPTFPGTGSWTTWSSIVMMVPLQAGMNRLRFAATTNSSPNANIDRIYVGGQSATQAYKLVLSSSGSGTVSAAPASPDSFYDAGTSVTLTASPSGGSSFYHWSGTEPGTANPWTIALTSNHTEIGVMPLNPGFGDFPYESAPKGFAAVGAFTYPDGTTGGTGPGSSSVYVTNSDDLGNLLLRRVDVDHSLNFPPLTIYVIGTLTPGSVVTDMCDVKDVYDISIIGVGVDATLSGFGLNVVRAKNIIVRNLKIQNSPIDGITVQADDVDGTGNHLWFDHNTITNCYDGALDITHTASYATVSWNHFYNHDKLCLMGHSDSQTSDVTMKVTYHHNYFDSTGQRHPRVRYGKAHVYNNYYRKNHLYGVSSNDGADVLVEGNYFLNVPLPTDTSRDGSVPGDVVERNNIFNNCGAPPQTRGTAFEASAYYGYSVNDPATLPALLPAYAGSGKWDFSGGGIPVPTPPGIPTLVVPLNGAMGVQQNPVLVWRRNFDTDRYRVQLGLDSTFVSSILLDSTLTDTVCAATGLQYSTVHYWRVRAINAVGAGSYSFPWRFRTLGAPASVVQLSPAVLNFGAVSVHDMERDTMKVKSTGTLTLHVDSIRCFGGDFAAMPTSSAVLPVGDSLIVAVTFSPTAVGAHVGYLVVFSDAASSPDSLHLSGSGVQAAFSGFPNPLTFGNVTMGANAIDTMTVTNVGTATLTLDSARAGGGDFTVNPGGRIAIPSGANLRYAVTFTPTSPGMQNGNIVFYSNAPSSPDSIPVSGTGVMSTVSLQIPLSGGWNMISLPVDVADDSAAHLFPGLVSRVFKFSGGYIPEDTMGKGVGYWGKFGAAMTQTVSGAPRTFDSISVVTGWNMVGSISSVIDTGMIGSVPQGLRASNWFGYDGQRYVVVTQIIPGEAYWVKVNMPGRFVFGGPQASGARHSDLVQPMKSVGGTAPRGSVNPREGDIR